jgi:hypothetical protein
LDGRDIQLAHQLAQVASFPEQALADASQVSLREAGRVVERAATVEQLPALAPALAAGTIGAGHVDVFTKALRRLEPHQRSRLLAKGDRLVSDAAGSTPDEFDREVTAVVRGLQADDGMNRLERQRRATRLRTWVDRDGMWRLSGCYDPETGLRLHGRLAATVDTLFAERVPPCCPSDPIEKQDFLRAQALTALTDGRGAGAGRAEIVIVVDTTQVHADGEPVVDWGLPVELPWTVLHDLYPTAHIDPVIVCHGAVIHARGNLNLGRTTRLANRPQRRALRALYPTCAMPGCHVRFGDCHIHHVVFWEDGGRTDLDQLLPLCWLHHHCVHRLGWRLTLTPDRTLTITYPDGTTTITGPPRRQPTRPQPRPTAPSTDAPAPEPLTLLRT